MSNPFFERPILNSPYEYPSGHWELDEQGQPTQRIRWALAEFTEVYKIEADFAEKVEAEFNKMINAETEPEA